MKKIFAILIALSALSNFSCKEKEEEYTEGGLVFGGIYMLDGQQLVETDGYMEYPLNFTCLLYTSPSPRDTR